MVMYDNSLAKWAKGAKVSALAVGMCALLYALDTMQLGKMPYTSMIIDQLNQ
jgi:hypothetical protein